MTLLALIGWLSLLASDASATALPTPTRITMSHAAAPVGEVLDDLRRQAWNLDVGALLGAERAVDV